MLDQYIVDGREEENNPGIHELCDEDEAGLQSNFVLQICFTRFDFEIKTERTHAVW